MRRAMVAIGAESFGARFDVIGVHKVKWLVNEAEECLRMREG